MKLPSDLAGVSLVPFNGSRVVTNIEAAVREAYLPIRRAVEEIGPLERTTRETGGGSKYRGFADEKNAPAYRQAYRLVAYVAGYAERRLIELGGERTLVNPEPGSRFLELGIKAEEGSWQVISDRTGIYLHARTIDGDHPLTAYCAVPQDWDQYSSWDYGRRIADELLSQLAEGVRLKLGQRP